MTAPHHRRSIRLKNYDYRSPGAYYVTLCTDQRRFLLGRVAGRTVELSVTGRMVNQLWLEMPHHYDGVELDQFQVMPNHIHGIIMLNLGRGPPDCITSLPAVVQRFKSLSLTLYRRELVPSKAPRGTVTLWHRNYYEHVIRDEKELARIRQYILDNPARWSFDRENPEAVEPEQAEAWEEPQEKD